ncbi:MAG TPA: hypothetical protein VHG30_06990 [Microvirga sp.]|nr:hypothetical protein [Microvirga sp.]
MQPLISLGDDGAIADAGAPERARSSRQPAPRGPGAGAPLGLAPHFEIADLPQGTGLCESGDPIRDAYCPRDCLVSLAAVLKDGDPVLDGEPGDAHPSGRGPHPEEPRRLTVTDRAGLKDISGECYGVIRRAFERLLPDTYARR